MPFWLLLVAGGIFGLDQFTKMLVAHRLAPGQEVLVTPWLAIRRVANARGVPLLRPPMAQLLFLTALFGGLCLIVWQGDFFQNFAARLGLGLALGGAASNVYDRLRRGAVMDFVDLGWWPVFNLADVAITTGVLAALCFLH
jgi:signal peptidase II